MATLSNIGTDAATTSLGSTATLATASPNPVLTVVTTSVTIVPAPTGTEIPTPETIATTISITDAASYAALTASAAAQSTSNGKTTRSAVSTSPSSPAIPTSSPHSSSTSLSTGAQAGIAVGCVLGILLLGIAAFLWYSRRRRRLLVLLQSEAIASEKVDKSAQLGEDNDELSQYRAELPGQSAKQGGVLRKAELMTNANYHELEAREAQQFTQAMQGRAEIVESDVPSA